MILTMLNEHYEHLIFRASDFKFKWYDIPASEHGKIGILYYLAHDIET